MRVKKEKAKAAMEKQLHSSQSLPFVAPLLGPLGAGAQIGMFLSRALRWGEAKWVIHSF